ncbi:energy coupling factor transporter S component ThiW [Defluviitalea phaphyphila]|uniref:energy coupling factor transporter S component ThiW n=1 Tax=Defluviitalea phaphyphila TaxID=1473580 RepID=UPI0007316B25|nr:energy coupling factor transporter S component ThiW [Defluviitalea phaphyphila]
MKAKKISLSAIFIAIGVIAGNVIFIPIGASKCFPVQHTINVLTAIILGPSYSVAVAFSISLLRNILGTGSLLAFPGSMIGALLAGLIYKKTNIPILAVTGEVFGTGIIGGILAYPIAKFIIGNDVTSLFFIAPFSISTIGGSIISYIIIKIMDFSKIGYIKKDL